ncbi:MAG: prohibitin family protein [Tepidiformaceae bacterium]
MPWILSLLAAIVICGAVFFFSRLARSAAADGTPERLRATIIMVAVSVVFILWVGLTTLAASLKTVEAGNVMVVYQFGEIVGQKSEGLQFILPWQTTKTQSVQVQRFKFENVSGFSQETQDVYITATINYSVSPGAVQNLYRTVGENWFDRLIEPRLVNFLKEETVKYPGVEIAPNREKIRQIVRDKLTAELAPFSITVTDLLLDNIDFSNDFKKSIEGKQIATQDALRAQEKVKQSQFEAQQQIETAKGDAESTKVRAEGQAAANKALAASLTPEVIQFQAIQKLGDKIQIALIPSGQGVIIDPTTLFGGVKK